MITENNTTFLGNGIKKKTDREEKSTCKKDNREPY
jgi:hypothetical protein